jgi:ParB family chromosome partitioning protein
MHEMALIENIQREDLNVIEEASAYQSLIERFNYTQENVSQKVGKSRSAVTNTIRLLKLSKKIREDLINNRITMGHARAYLGLDGSSMQEKAHSIVIKRDLSVRNTEKLITKIKKGNNNKISKTEQAQNEFIIDELRKKFSTKVNIIRKGDRGKIVIEYYSGEEFEKIYELLRG